MRIATTFTLILLLPISGWGQAASAPGHFADWPSDWGAEKRTFDVRFGFQHVEATFSVAQNGFGWQRAFTDSKETFNAWADVTAWCWAPGTLAFRTRQGAGLDQGVYGIKPEDLATVVDGYFKKYVPEAEWSAPGWACTPAALNRPNPANMSKVRELLEAASDKP
jgi:hypothetical protein